MSKVLKLTADGVTANFPAKGTFRVHASGDFGGGTLTLREDVLKNGEFESITESAKTEASDFIVEGVALSEYNFSLAGSTSPDITITVTGTI